MCFLLLTERSNFHSLYIGGGVDPDKNTALAAVLKRLKAQDVPKDNIAKALAKVKNGVLTWWKLCLNHDLGSQGQGLRRNFDLRGHSMQLCRCHYVRSFIIHSFI